jgi:hypothetical protein
MTTQNTYQQYQQQYSTVSGMYCLNLNGEDKLV